MTNVFCSALLLLSVLPSHARAGSLSSALRDPKNYPAYIANETATTPARVKRFTIDGKAPTGEIACEHIRIHNGKDERALVWDARDAQASNVYFHIHRAIDYFNWLESVTGEKIYRETRPVLLRLHMEVDWMMWEKFSTLPRYNTAQTFPDVDSEKWGTAEEEREIWFFIPKRKYMPGYVLTRYVPWLKDTSLGTVGFPLDSAYVPSIIYHEWTHLMTRPYLGITKNTVLAEAYSDYFGSAIVGRPEMGDSPEFSSTPYVHHFDKKVEPAQAIMYEKPGPFIPNLLWALRRELGSKKIDMLAWLALKHFTPESRVAEFPKALLLEGEKILDARELELLRARLQHAFAPVNGRKGS